MQHLFALTASKILQLYFSSKEVMYQSLSKLILLFTLVLIHLYSANSQEEGTCGSEELRRATVNKQLTALGCDNFTCGMLKFLYIASQLISYFLSSTAKANTWTYCRFPSNLLCWDSSLQSSISLGLLLAGFGLPMVLLHMCTVTWL